ncbi:unnamed protein product, partial [Ceratitis capitata]
SSSGWPTNDDSSTPTIAAATTRANAQTDRQTERQKERTKAGKAMNVCMRVRIPTARQVKGAWECRTHCQTDSRAAIEV